MGADGIDARRKPLGQRLLIWNSLLVVAILPFTVWFRVSGFLLAPGVLIMFITYFTLGSGGGARGSQVSYTDRAMTGAIEETKAVTPPLVIGALLAGTWLAGAVLGYLIERLLF